MMGTGYYGKKLMAAGRGIDTDSYFYQSAIWQEKFVWWPQVCAISYRRLWLCKAMKGTAVWRDLNESIAEHRWHDSKEHIMWLLKNSK